ncbi:MAG: hypothetical protein CME63_13675 [Halobacteriovoraceae bacterium]|nr:hypothetical protein [Halobacteriovoraceae bacterium]|tara:strand:- start:2089 stop:3600 length:1512 start_codon:yes stop_codon:yes gene_type:complete
MYVRKFEAETLDEALKAIKRELGPDAIILKTVTNKGIKGAFKKNRIEITAAISEKNYTKKARVDHSLDSENRDKFYEGNSNYISSMIDNYSDNRSEEKESMPSGYGSVGLNKSVKNISNKMKNSLDDFLSGGQDESASANNNHLGAQNTYRDSFNESYGEQYLEQEPKQVFVGQNERVDNFYPREEESFEEEIYQATTEARAPIVEKERATLSEKDSQEIMSQRQKIDELEKRLYELTKNVQRIERPEPAGILQLRTTLRSLDINELTVNEIIKKAVFELSEDDIQDVDTVFEFALREMLDRIHVQMPRFSNLEGSEEPFVTILLSENSCGQSSMLYKLGALKEDSVLIKYQPGKENDFTEKVFGLNVAKVNTIPEIISQIRKSVEKGQSVFVDYRNYKTEINDTKKFIDGLKRSFGKVEVMICLSSIHSEIYNRKVISTYQNISDGLIVTHLDQCLNYGAIFNICEEYPKLPLKFFGTGDVIPDDIEAATGERILAGMFKLN